MRKLFLALLVVVMVSPAQAFSRGGSEGNKDPWPLYGVNLPAVECGDGCNIFPNRKEMNYFGHSGMRVVRFSIKWERLQPTPSGSFDSSYLAKVTSSINYITDTLGLYVLVDLHNYGTYDTIPLNDPDAATTEDYIDFWLRFLSIFGNNKRVLIDTMNEPVHQSAVDWGIISQALITAVRNAGYTNWLFIEGGGSWSSANAFVSSGWGAEAVKLKDPLNRIIFSPHSYLDADSSGQSATCKTGTGSSRLETATAFAKANGLKLFLGEFGFGENDGCYVEATAFLKYIKNNPDVWVGWTYWAGGGGMGASYSYQLNPSSFVPLIERGQMSLLRQYIQ